MVPCSIEFFSRKNSKQPNVHGCIFGCDGIRAASELTSLSMLGREFACCKLTALTGCQWFHAVSSFSQGKTRSNQMYMDVHLVAMASMAVLNAYLRVHGSTSSLPRKFEVKECTGRTFFNDDIHSGRKMVGIPPSHE